jgi:hypothetical protein
MRSDVKELSNSQRAISPLRAVMREGELTEVAVRYFAGMRSNFPDPSS